MGDVVEISAEEWRTLRQPRLKYGNRRPVAYGRHWHSQAELTRYEQLSLLEQAGAITGLTLQPRYPLHVNGHLICAYVADFTYTRFDEAGVPTVIVEDVKGFQTDLYKVKKKLMLAVYGVEIQEIPIDA